MNKRRFAAILCCSALLAGAFGCGGKKSSSSSSAAEETSKVDGMEWVTPQTDDKEYELGSYAIDPDTGVKLYYSPEEFPKEMVLSLERLFLAYQNRDFETYKDMLVPRYKEMLEPLLQEEFDYGLDKSFELQCDRLKGYAEDGDYKVTRVKIEPTAKYATEEAGIDDVLNSMGEFLDDPSFAESVKKESDELRIGSFYVMAEVADGDEHNLVGEKDVVFAVKDGKYYTFG